MQSAVEELVPEKYPAPPPESGGERKARMIALFIMPFLIITMMYATYVGTSHDAAPQDVPVGVVGAAGVAAASTTALAQQLEAAAGGTLDLVVVRDAGDVEGLLRDGEIAGAIEVPSGGGGARLYTAAATGASQASLVTGLVSPLAEAQGWTVEPVELAPLPPGDTSGTAAFFAAMGMMLAGYVPLSAILLGTPNLVRVRAFLPLSVAWAAVSSTIIWTILGPVIGAVDGHFLPFVAIGTLAVMAVHTTQLLFTKLVGPFAVLLGMLLWVIFGVPASGLALPIDTMPGFFQWLHHVLPLPAAGEAIRSVLYFGGQGIGGNLLVLGGWLAAGLGLSAVKERKSGHLITGGPAYIGRDAPLPALAGGPVAGYRRRLTAVTVFPLAIVITVVTVMGFSLHQPTLHDMPVAVVGSSAAAAEQFVDAAQPGLEGLVSLESAVDEGTARDLIREQRLVAAYVLPEGPGEAPTLIAASGAGASQLSVARSVFEPIAQQSGQDLMVDDVAPLTDGDALGSNSMYVGMAWVLAGLLFLAVLRGGAPDLTRTRQLLPLVAGWSVGISVWLWFLFDVLIGAVNGHALELIAYGTVVTFSTAWATAILTRSFGMMALVPAMIAVILAGVPASGGGLSIYMVPEFFRPLADILLLPAAVDLARAVVYFDGTGVGADLLVVAVWGVVSLALNVLVVDRWVNRAGAKPHAPLGPRHGSAPSNTQQPV